MNTDIRTAAPDRKAPVRGYMMRFPNAVPAVTGSVGGVSQ